MLHKRTSLEAPPRAAERLTAVAADVEASPRPRAVEPRPLVAKVATSERPVRVREGTGEHVDMGWLGEKGAEFERWRLPRAPSNDKKSSSSFEMMVTGAPGRTCPGNIPDKCNLSSLPDAASHRHEPSDGRAAVR